LLTRAHRTKQKLPPPTTFSLLVAMSSPHHHVHVYVVDWDELLQVVRPVKKCEMLEEFYDFPNLHLLRQDCWLRYRNGKPRLSFKKVAARVVPNHLLAYDELNRDGAFADVIAEGIKALGVCLCSFKTSRYVSEQFPELHIDVSQWRYEHATLFYAVVTFTTASPLLEQEKLWLPAHSKAIAAIRTTNTKAAAALDTAGAPVLPSLIFYASNPVETAAYRYIARTHSRTHANLKRLSHWFN